MVGHFRCEECGKVYRYKKGFDTHMLIHIREKVQVVVPVSTKDGLVDFYVNPIYPIHINGKEYVGIVRVRQDIADTLKNILEQKLNNEQKIHQYHDHRLKNTELEVTGY